MSRTGWASVFVRASPTTAHLELSGPPRSLLTLPITGYIVPALTQDFLLTITLASR